MISADGVVSEDAWYQVPPNLGAVFGIARQVLCKKLLFVVQAPRKAGDCKRGGNESPIGTERQGHGDKEDDGA